MHHTTTQNPANRVGRNSGAGPGGVTEVIPTEKEAERGLEPFSIEPHTGRSVGRMVGIGAAALAGVGLSVYATLRMRRRRTLMGRVQEMLPSQRQIRRTIGRIEMPEVDVTGVRRSLSRMGVPGVAPRGRLRRLIGR
jgi:hypothetical protein